MPNLDKIFNKFFPQSQTGAKGIFLLRMAWTVEIIVAIIGLFIGIIIIKNAQGSDTIGDVFTTAIRLNLGLIFIIVAVVELTKIPLATAVYYSVRLSWKIVFLIGLLLVNISTFETIVTGFERINRERSKVVDRLIVEYHGIKKEIFNLQANTQVSNIQEQIDTKIKERSVINKEIAEINSIASKNKSDIQGSTANAGVITTLVKEIESIDKKIEGFEKEENDLFAQENDPKTKWYRKDNIKKERESIKEKINKLEVKRENKIIQLKKERASADADISGTLESIDSDKEARIQPKLAELEIVNQAIADLQERQKNINIDADQKDKEEKTLEKRKKDLIQAIDEQAPDNQIFRVALWFKDWFEVDYSKEITDLEQRILKLEKSKISDAYFSNWFLKKIFFFIKRENTPQDNAAIDRNIVRLEKQIKDYETKMNFTEVSDTTQAVYADLPRAALTAAFWLWFGVLSFIISVTGTMLAFASLVLLDPRLHVIRNKPGASWRGVARRISGFFVMINKYIWGRVKRLKDPQIKIVKKEVIVEKPVIEEKIVFKDREIPVEIEKIKEYETVRKEMVYVPLPTDNEELLKKGPVKAPDYDNKDKKK